MDTIAMSYEYVIRRAHQCGRFGVPGANADNYRRLQRNAQIYITEKKVIAQKGQRTWLQSEEDMLKNYMISAGEIAAYLNMAIDHVLKMFEGKLTDQQKQGLENLIVSMIDPDIKKLDSVVKKAEKIMLEIGLYPK